MNLEKYENDVLFVPLGGVGEIGLNMYLYGHKGKWLIVDFGIGFADDAAPGVDIILPDPAFIEERKKDLLGLVITHAHEDHIGAIAYLWEHIRCPIYASPFARELIESRLDDAGLLGRVDIRTLEMNSSIDIEPFTIQTISVNHSIPEANALVICTAAGNIVHTGDWKFDTNPLIGEEADYGALEKLGKDGGVLAVVGDSTNVFSEGFSPSEGKVRDTFEHMIGKYKQKVLVACFSSNVARIESIAQAGRKNGRKVCLLGRSLWRVDGAARMVGYFDDLPEFLSEDEASRLPPEKVLYICTGSQGEKRSALYTVANSENRYVSVGQGDAVIFSSRVIPGNETEISLIQNRLSVLGAEVVTVADNPEIHASGHSYREDIRKMYSLVKPKYVIPVHGEQFHLEEHAKFALELGAKKALEIKDGDIVLLSADACEIVGQAQTGILAIDGKRIIRLDSEVFKKRRKIIYSGSLVITVVLNKNAELVSAPQISSIGLFDETSDEIAVIKGLIKEVVEQLDAPTRLNDFAIKEQIKMSVRRYVLEIQGNKPLTEIHLVRV